MKKLTFFEEEKEQIHESRQNKNQIVSSHQTRHAIVESLPTGLRWKRKAYFQFHTEGHRATDDECASYELEFGAFCLFQDDTQPEPHAETPRAPFDTPLRTTTTTKKKTFQCVTALLMFCFFDCEASVSLLTHRFVPCFGCRPIGASIVPPVLFFANPPATIAI